jgi:CHAD domain-containing protein
LQQRRRSLERLLRSARFERLRRNLERFLTAGAVAPAQRRMAAVPFAAVTPELVRRSLRKALRYGRRLKASSPHMDLHALRRRCRRLRYLGEFFHALYGRPLRKLVRRAEACQDALGRLQDAIVACSMIRRFRRAAQRKLFDLLESHFLEYALDSRREFQQAWSRLARKSMRQKALKQIRRRTRKPGRIQADSSG